MTVFWETQSDRLAKKQAEEAAAEQAYLAQQASNNTQPPAQQ